MLLSFRVANHRSLRDEQQLLLTPQYGDAGRGGVSIAGIFGANAAGKSNVLDALQYMRRMVLASHLEAEPGGGLSRHPFMLDSKFRAEPSYFAVDVVLGRVRHTYGFAVNDEQIVEEWLSFYPKGRVAKVFERKRDSFSYGDYPPSSLRKIEEITEPNVLFLSVAARSRQRIPTSVYSWFSRDVRSPSLESIPLRPRILETLSSEGDRARLARLLKAADLGIEDVLVTEPAADDIAAVQERLGALPDDVREIRRRLLVRDMRRLAFSYDGPEERVTLGLDDQSRGTRALLRIATSALDVLHRGGVLVVDELDASLHPYLSAQIIKLFKDPESNRRNAQLLFTSHDVSLLGQIQGEEVLKRDHIWFVEKNEHGATELYPLTEFQPRMKDNRERRYMKGTYGAVPRVQEEMFKAALAGRGDDGDAPPEE